MLVSFIRKKVKTTQHRGTEAQSRGEKQEEKIGAFLYFVFPHYSCASVLRGLL